MQDNGNLVPVLPWATYHRNSLLTNLRSDDVSISSPFTNPRLAPTPDCVSSLCFRSRIQAIRFVTSFFSVGQLQIYWLLAPARNLLARPGAPSLVRPTNQRPDLGRSCFGVSHRLLNIHADSFLHRTIGVMKSGSGISKYGNNLALNIGRIIPSHVS